MRRWLGRLAARIAAAADGQQRQARWSPAVKVALRQLWLDHRTRAARGAPLPSIWTTGFRIFSQFDEDGIILFLFASLGDGPGLFLDIGAGDGVAASNCANLAINFDGNDYWVWQALTAVQRRVVVIGTHPELGRRALVAPYAEDPARVPGQPAHFLGASPAAMTALARRLGYRLVGANRFGVNLFYVREELAGLPFLEP